MTLAVVRSIDTPRRLSTAQEYEDFDQELVDQFLLAGVRGLPPYSSCAKPSGTVTVFDAQCAGMASRPTADDILEKARLQYNV
ncbi:hypothetical protein [Streptomyces flavidovirens]|uniref:hypothetical protein n=1 Tax=Streptomyces flavidovirens TaxID=67298 RepID=UPI0003FBD464|nr:hypothetical protein [Streptomyces flavidovirens]